MANRWQRIDWSVVSFLLLILGLAILAFYLPGCSCKPCTACNPCVRPMISSTFANVLAATTTLPITIRIAPPEPDGATWIGEMGKTVYTCTMQSSTCTFFVDPVLAQTYQSICIYPRVAPDSRHCIYWRELTVNASKRRIVAHGN